ncbi:MAG: endonuclease/exonuclease/phosphatase family protein [Fimbriimonadaceae bacterium]|nr:endonuclease/exonuclease/phosphatase family protein [Chitinophagales bacterium]
MKWYNKIILFFTILAAIALLLSYAARYINPAKFWFMAYFGLGYFPIMIVNLFFLLYWFFAKRKIFFIILILFLIGFRSHTDYFAFNMRNKTTEGANTIKLFSWNVKGLDAYNPETPYKNRDPMIKTIIDAKADIVCLQEFNTYQNESDQKKNLDVLLKGTGLKHYYYFKAYENRKKTRSFGVIILSKFPIKDSGVVPYKNVSKLNATIYADIDIDGKLIRLFTAHLQSTQLTHHDLEFIDPIEGSGETNFNTDRVVNKLNSAFRMRAAQADSVNNAIKNSPNPVIICGDFNDTPVSYTYHTVADDLQDAFLETGLGMGNTFIMMPFLRIDYMLFDEDNFEILSHKRIKTKTSDHYPTISEFEIIK